MKLPPRTHWGKCSALAIATLALAPGTAVAQTTLVVDADGQGTATDCNAPTPAFSTISTAIAAATAGDTVLVCPGTYQETVNFLGKAVTVTSKEGPEVTIVDGNLMGSVVAFVSGEGSKSVLNGFTLQNGRPDFGPPSFGNGGGIVVRNASPTITANILVNNQACAGPGISISSGSPLIQGNIIFGNFQANCTGGVGGGGISISSGTSADAPQILDNVIAYNFMGSADGGGISVFAGSPTISGNIISANIATGLSPCARGGGIALANSLAARVIQNLITGNGAGCGGGVFTQFGTSGTRFVNNTIADNDSEQGSGIAFGAFVTQNEVVNNIVVAGAGQFAILCQGPGDPPRFRFNNVFSPSGTNYGGMCADQTGLNRNISADPLFVDAVNGEYHLQPRSPSIDDGDNTAPELSTTDLDGNPRVVDGTGHCKAVIDMGVYEFATQPSQLPFTDDPLGVQVTPVRAIHFNELRTAINARRALFGLAAFAFTDPTLISTMPVQAVHLTELREALAQAYQAARRSTPTYSEPTITSGETTIKASHICELRAAVRALRTRAAESLVR